MLIPPKHSGIPGLAMVSYIFGAMLILAGACIVFEKKNQNNFSPVSWCPSINILLLLYPVSTDN